MVSSKHKESCSGSDPCMSIFHVRVSTSRVDGLKILGVLESLTIYPQRLTIRSATSQVLGFSVLNQTQFFLD